MKYKRSMLRRGLLAGAMALAGCGAGLAVASAPAGASNTEMTVVGSFTTFFMIHALFPAVNDVNPNPEIGSQTQSIASDSLTCSGGVTYTTSHQPPNGSGAGKVALAAEENGRRQRARLYRLRRLVLAPSPARGDAAERHHRVRRPERVAPRLLRLRPRRRGTARGHRRPVDSPHRPAPTRERTMA